MRPKRPPRKNARKIPAPTGSGRATGITVGARGGKVIGRAIESAGRGELLGLLQKQVVPGGVTHNDQYPSYTGSSKRQDKNGRPSRYRHYRIKRSHAVYVRGKIRMSSDERFWILLRR